MIEMIIGGVLTALTGVSGTLTLQYFQRKKTEAETDKVHLGNDQIKWDFQQKVMEDMREELDRRDAECERRLKAVEQKMNGKLEGIVAEIQEKCINNCFAKNFDK